MRKVYCDSTLTEKLFQLMLKINETQPEALGYGQTARVKDFRKQKCVHRDLPANMQCMVHQALVKLAQSFGRVLPSVVQQIVACICLARDPLLSRPRNEAAYGFVPKKRLPRGESLRQRKCVVCSVYGAVARAANLDRSI